MKNPVVAIGLDAADPVLMEEWMAEGHLPVLSRLCEQGGYGRIDNLDYYKAETPWTTFLTGCMPQKTGYWSGAVMDEHSYTVREIEAYEYSEFPPFYALGDKFDIAAFDIPQTTLREDANGPQVLAWGAHSPQTPSHSYPESLLDDVQKQYGEHPGLHNDHGPWWSEEYLKALHQNLVTGIRRRADICVDWLNEKPRDLFFTIFGEPHSAGHDFWHLSRPDHPLYERVRGMFDEDPMLDVFREVDTAVGRILDAAPENSYKIVFSVHGSGNNVTDVASMALLPEFLYRWSFPGKQAIGPGEIGDRLPEPLDPARDHEWQHEMSEYRYDPNPLSRLLKSFVPHRYHRAITRRLGGETAPDLYTIDEMEAAGEDLSWQPAHWYKKVWPQMKAFALPTFSEGYIRVNLAGREPNGIVQPEDYLAVCDELEEALMTMTNPRTGKPIVKKVVRIRESADDDTPGLAQADLVVVWNEDPADVVEHPAVGRIGPLPFRRTGSHRGRGFWAASGHGIDPGTDFPEAHCVDLTATILALLQAPLPNYLDGRPIIWPRRQEMAAGS